MNAPRSPALRELVVTAADARMRLDRFVAKEAPEFSRVNVQRFIRQGLVLLNGRAARPREIVHMGDHVTLGGTCFCTSQEFRVAQVKNGDVQKHVPPILFEDADLIVFDKPAGLTVHAGAGTNSVTLVDALRLHSRNLSAVGGESRPGIVHRLDKQTSGCLVVAKNDRAHLALSRQFAARTVEKIYLALVAGKLRKNVGTIDAAISRHRVHRTKMAVAREGGREARTEFRVLRGGMSASLVECRLHSGRTHQIRVHLQHLGHPILGDAVYAGRRAGNYPRQMLHAWKLAFDHPRTGARMHFEAPLPDDFEIAMKDVL